VQEIFIALFIAFNAMYGRRQYESDKTQTNDDLESFISKLERMHDADLSAGRATLTKPYPRLGSSLHPQQSDLV
jgi:hypothetical protein